MELLKNPTSVKLMATEIIKACDAYVSRTVSEKILKELLWHYASVHGCKLFSIRGIHGYNLTIVKRIGQKRLDLVKILLNGYQMRL